MRHPEDEVRIGFVGKYVDFDDSYKSLNEALVHGGIANDVKVRIVYIDSESLEEEGYHGELASVDGILVARGFGARGVEGKLRAIRYAREKQDPVLRHLPRHAVRDDRVRAQRRRHGRRELDRVRRRGAVQSHLQAARPHRRRRPRRHDASRQVSVRPEGRLDRARGLRRPSSSRSATAIATK